MFLHLFFVPTHCGHQTILSGSICLVCFHSLCHYFGHSKLKLNMFLFCLTPYNVSSSHTEEHKLLSGAELSLCWQHQNTLMLLSLGPTPCLHLFQGTGAASGNGRNYPFPPICFGSAEGIRSSFPVDFKSSRTGCLSISWEHCLKDPCIGWVLHSNHILV